MRKWLFTKTIEQEPRVGVFHLSMANLLLPRGEDERVLRAIQDALDEAIVRPVIVARRRILNQKLPDLGLRFQLDRDVEVIDPETDHLVMGELVEAYRAVAARKGVPADEILRHVYRRPTVTDRGHTQRGAGVGEVLVSPQVVGDRETDESREEPHPLHRPCARAFLEGVNEFLQRGHG